MEPVQAATHQPGFGREALDGGRAVPDSVRVAGRAVDILESIGKLTGELRQLAPQSITNNTAIFVNSPIFAELQSMLIERLAPYPAALTAVVQGLHELEDRSAEGPANGLGSHRKVLSTKVLLYDQAIWTTRRGLRN